MRHALVEVFGSVLQQPVDTQEPHHREHGSPSTVQHTAPARRLDSLTHPIYRQRPRDTHPIYPSSTRGGSRGTGTFAGLGETHFYGVFLPHVRALCVVLSWCCLFWTPVCIACGYSMSGVCRDYHDAKQVQDQEERRKMRKEGSSDPRLLRIRSERAHAMSSQNVGLAVSAPGRRHGTSVFLCLPQAAWVFVS